MRCMVKWTHLTDLVKVGNLDPLPEKVVVTTFSGAGICLSGNNCQIIMYLYNTFYTLIQPHAHPNTHLTASHNTHTLTHSHRHHRLHTLPSWISKPLHTTLTASHTTTHHPHSLTHHPHSLTHPHVAPTSSPSCLMRRSNRQKYCGMSTQPREEELSLVSVLGHFVNSLANTRLAWSTAIAWKVLNMASLVGGLFLREDNSSLRSE